MSQMEKAEAKEDPGWMQALGKYLAEFRAKGDEEQEVAKKRNEEQTKADATRDSGQMQAMAEYWAKFSCLGKEEQVAKAQDEEQAKASPDHLDSSLRTESSEGSAGGGSPWRSFPSPWSKPTEYAAIPPPPDQPSSSPQAEEPERGGEAAEHSGWLPNIWQNLPDLGVASWSGRKEGSSDEGKLQDAELSVTMFRGAREHKVDGVPIEVSAPQGTPVDNKFFRGQVLFLHRPPTEPAHGDWPYAKHFTGKKRRAEFRLQGVFKADPGDLFFGMELQENTTLNWSLKVTMDWVLSVIGILTAARGGTFSYNIELKKLPDGDIIRPFSAFPLVTGESVTVTPAREVPPPLTSTFDASPLDERRAVRLNTKDTFTFAHWTMEVDLFRWEICNMPFGFRASFRPFIGDQPIYLSVYGLKKSIADGGSHAESNKNRIVHFMVKNIPKTSDCSTERKANSRWRRWGLGRMSCWSRCGPWCR